VLIELRPDSADASNGQSRVGRSPSRGRSAARRTGTALPGGWIALSGTARGVAALPEAANEARFVASLLAAELLPTGLERFDALSDVGAYRLLYRFWGTPELEAFAHDALGELLTRDRRGSLRRTLLVFLECGGSHVEAAKRLGIHRNTLAYRLEQIADLTGRDPDDPATWLVCHLGLLAASLPPVPALARQFDQGT
jgi:DNA-binding PucR family transcriptional regulator